MGTTSKSASNYLNDYEVGTWTPALYNSSGKAVSYNAKVIILDEPTSSLTENECNKLFDIIGELTKKNVAIVYISHKIDEVFKLSDEISVLRDGHLVKTADKKDVDENELISLMVGRDLTDRYPAVDNVPGEVHMEVKNLISTYKPKIKDVSFQ